MQTRTGVTVVMAVALTLVAAACGSSPLETLDDSAGYVLGEPPEGYVACGVNVRTGLEIASADDAHLIVYADTSRDDPYLGPLYGVASFAAADLATLPLGDTADLMVGDQPARVGAADGFQLADLPAEAGTVVTWQVDGTTIQLLGRAVTADDVVALAPAVSLDDGGAVIDGDDRPDGIESLGDVYAQEGQARFLFSADYELPSATPDRLDDQLTLLGSAGDRAGMEAFRFRAASSERVDISGRPGVVADVSADGSGPNVVSWLARDGLILRIFSFEEGTDDLAALAREVEYLEGTAWADAVAAPPDPACVARS